MDAMTNTRFSLPLQVRYGDLDPQWHVNNANFLTYLEAARFTYLRELELWDGVDYFKVGLIVADVHCAYLAPIALGDSITVRMRAARIGSKSILFEYVIENDTTGVRAATAETVMVAYDYHTHQSIPVPEDWRRKIAAYEGWDAQG